MSAARAIPVATNPSRAMAYVSLTKPDVSFLVVMTTLAGYYLGSRGPLDWARMLHTVFGTTLVAAGTSALNHYIERASDAFMRRTASRPLPTGQLRPRDAAIFGVTLVVLGTVYLGLVAGLLAARLGSVHGRKLPRSIYAAEEAYDARDRDWRHSWRDASANWVGGGAWIAFQRGVDIVRDHGAVAISALLRDCLDVSRGLRARRN